MTSDHQTDVEHELADVLRRVLRRMHEEAAPPEQVREATALARQMEGLLAGEPRPAWFAQGFSDDRHERLERMRRRDHALYRGRSNPMSIPLALRTLELDDGQMIIEGRATIAPMYEGPPNGVHGGYVAGLFDDILGATQSLIDGPTGLTGTLHVRYRNLTPLDTELVFRAWVDHVSGRRIVSRAVCHAGSVLTAEAEAMFVRVDMEAIARRKAP